MAVIAKSEQMVCQSCGDSREVFTSQSTHWIVPDCQKCGGEMGPNRPRRYTKLYGGASVHSRAERNHQREMKAKGYEQAGDEPVENIQATAARNRIDAKKRRRDALAKRVGAFVQEIGSDTAANLAAIELNGMLPSDKEIETEAASGLDRK